MVRYGRQLYWILNLVQVCSGIDIFTGKLRNLRVLGLNNNKVSSIPVELCHLTELLVLGLESNSIHEIPSQLGNLSNLIEVIIIKIFGYN